VSSTASSLIMPNARIASISSISIRCDGLPSLLDTVTNGTSFYELYSNGTTANWKTYENIDLTENALAINPFTDKLYATGTDTKSRISNLYIFDISPP
jgi:hypothetical protein